MMISCSGYFGLIVVGIEYISSFIMYAISSESRFYDLNIRIKSRMIPTSLIYLLLLYLQQIQFFLSKGPKHM